MHKNTDITIDSITKIEGNAQLDVKIREGKVDKLEFIIADYRRFYTEAVKGKPYAAVPSILSRICGTCSMAHLFASIKAIENALEISEEISEQTRTLRKLAINGMMIRDHSLHLYIFSLPDVLGIDSVLDIPETNQEQHQLLHDAFDLKAIGNKLSTIFAGAAVHSPFPVVGGFTRFPENNFTALINELEESREKALRGIKVFFDWEIELKRNTDFMALVNKDYNFTEGKIKNSNGDTFEENQFRDLLEEIIVPYSQSKSYTLKSNHEDYLVGALARCNLNLSNMHPRTLDSVKGYLGFFPSTNIYDNCLSQALETLHCIDQSIDILKNLKLEQEPPVLVTPKGGIGIGVIEAPRGTLYHKIELDAKGIVIDSDVIVPTSQNQINIENDLMKMFQDYMNKKSEDELKQEAEQIIRAYDPCMSCSTNFLKINYT